MDVLENSLSERSLSPSHPGLETRDVTSAGSGCARPGLQDSETNETTEKVQLEVSTPIVDHTSREIPNVLDVESSRRSNLAEGFEDASVKSVEQKETLVDENNIKTSAQMGIAVSDLSELEKVEDLAKNVPLHSDGKPLSPVLEDSSLKPSMDDLGLLPNQGATVSTTDNGVGEPCLDATENFGLQLSKPVQMEAVNLDAEVSLDKETPVNSRKRKSKLVSPEPARTLRSSSRSREKAKAPELKTTAIEYTANEARKEKRGRKKGMKNLAVNEFSSIRTRLRYLLHRINYEKNLIDAYSGEGWKGQSIEKIKPEKELQRAKFQIFRCKLKIRDVFQCLDALIGQGKLPETLFDSEGQIDSEDIFCAKCGSKDVTLDNDIILCDGACERGFHQFCLVPPLLKEHIPPGDEGWLCPGCDCKDDCLDMLNDFQGSRLSLFDNWEKVFPEEAAAAAAGKNMEDISSLQSEDSEDDDYNPNNQELDRKASGDESSDKSDYFSASDSMVPSRTDKDLAGLPSDDSEDDDFDPSAPSDDQPDEPESSGSDFTSDSEDLDAIVAEENCLDKDEGCVSSLSNYSKPDASAAEENLPAGKVSDELSHLLDTDVGPVSGKRQVERLDYKKLHDETYGDATSDSSDEEFREKRSTSDSSEDEYGEKVDNKRRKSSDGTAISGSTRGNRARKRRGGAKDADQHTPGVEGCRSYEVQGSNNAHVEAETSSGVSSSGKSASNRRLGEAVIQRLLESFKQNQYPEKEVKENLARELGIRVQQVSKWFENARWSFRHTTRMESKFAQISSRNGTPPPQLNENKGTEATRPGQNSSNLESSNAGDQLGNNASTVEQTPNQDVPVDAPKSQAARKSSRLRTRSSS